MTIRYIKFGENPKQNKSMLTNFVKKYSKNTTKDLIFISRLRDDAWPSGREYATINDTEYNAEFWFATKNDYVWDKEYFEDVTKECLTNDLGKM